MVIPGKECYTTIEMRYIIHTFNLKFNLPVKNCFGNFCSDNVNDHNQ